MRRVEAAEDEDDAGGGGQRVGARGAEGHLHLAIINLVIGTLYCSKARCDGAWRTAVVDSGFGVVSLALTRSLPPSINKLCLMIQHPPTTYTSPGQL